MEITVMIGLSLLTAAFVLLPILRRDRPADYDWDGSTGVSRAAARRAEIEHDVRRYRESLRAGTVCSRCGEANAPGSRFCADCGRPLAGTPAGSASAAEAASR